MCCPTSKTYRERAEAVAETVAAQAELVDAGKGRLYE